MKYKVTIEAVYDFSDPQFKRDYLEWLDDYSDSPSARRWYAVNAFAEIDYDPDRKINMEALGLDPRAELKVEEIAND